MKTKFVLGTLLIIGVEVWLASDQAGMGDGRLSLAANPSDDISLTSSSLVISDIKAPGFYRFAFPALQDSHSHDYYAYLTGYSEAVDGLVLQLATTPAASTEGHVAICHFPHKIAHVYLGQWQGMVNKALPRLPQQPMLSAELLLHYPAFQLIYHRDRVMIFEFDGSICSGSA